VGSEVSLKDLQSGDLLCFQNDDQTQVGHVGIYLGDGKFIHAANTKLGIIISDVSSWLTRLKTIRRLPELQQSAG
jgi:cell wall-associated NlpC family hydrolase